MRKMTIVYCGDAQSMAEYMLKTGTKSEDIIRIPDPDYALFSARTLKRAWLVTRVKLIYQVK